MVGKDWKSCQLGKIGHFESFWATSVGKDWKSCKSGKICHSKSFWATLVGKDWKSCELGEIGHSESFWATSVGKDWKSCKWLNWLFWVIVSHFWEKIGKGANCEIGHSKSFWATSVGKDWKSYNLDKIQLFQGVGEGVYISQKHNVMLTQNSSWIWKTDVFFSVYSTNNKAVGLMAQLSM